MQRLGDVVVVNNNSWTEKYFIPYTFNGDAVSLDFDNKVKCVVTYRAFEGEETTEAVNEKLEVVTANFKKHTCKIIVTNVLFRFYILHILL